MKQHTFPLTNTEKLALARILDEERQAAVRVKQLQSAFESDLRARLKLGPAGTLRIDVGSGTMEIQYDFEKPRDAIPD